MGVLKRWIQKKIPTNRNKMRGWAKKDATTNQKEKRVHNNSDNVDPKKGRES